jgi:aspartate ammonia-lyase
VGRCGFARACSWFRRFVTALNPVLGYEKSAAIAEEALVNSRSVYELVLEKNLLTKTQLDDILKPENMTHPRKLPSTA